LGAGPGAGAGGALAALGPGSGLGHSGEAGDGLDLSPYIARLRHSAAACAPRRHSHPGLATAQVRFCVAPNGVATDVELQESTGSAELDRAALDCVVPGAAPFPPADRCLVVPLNFQ
jgi:TonB family protein